LENIKIFLKHKNSEFVKYENRVLEYNVNFWEYWNLLSIIVILLLNFFL
jgi:hypothetical protein